MDTRQIMCCLRYVGSFLGVFPSDLLPEHSIARSGTLIVNTDPHTESGSHWLAIHFQSKSHTSYYFDSYGLLPYIPSIQSIRHNCSVWDYNTVQLQGPTSTVWANTAVSSPCTWTEVIHQNNSSVFLLQRPSTRLFGTCSRRNFGLYEIYLEEGSAAAVEIKRK